MIAALTTMAAAGHHQTRNTLLFVLAVLLVCGLLFSGNRR